APLERHEATDETGTTITWWPSPTIFETVDHSFETLASRFREYAFLNKGLEIVVRDERPERAAGIADAVADNTVPDSVDGGSDAVTGDERVVERRFLYQDGLIDYVRHLNKTKDEAHRSIVNFEAENADHSMSLEVAMQWNTSFTESVHTFANTINTHEGG